MTPGLVTSFVRPRPRDGDGASEVRLEAGWGRGEAGWWGGGGGGGRRRGRAIFLLLLLLLLLLSDGLLTHGGKKY